MRGSEKADDDCDDKYLCDSYDSFVFHGASFSKCAECGGGVSYYMVVDSSLYDGVLCKVSRRLNVRNI